MEKKLIAKIFLAFLGVLVVFGLIFRTDDPNVASAQGGQISGCTNVGPYVSRWPNGAVVYMVRGSGWSDIMWHSVVVSAENWNQTNAQNGVQVSFNYTQAPPNSTASRIIWEWGGTIPNNNGSTPIAIVSRTTNSTGYLTSATVRVDPAIQVQNSQGQMVQALSTPLAMQRSSGHEIGHTMGLGETIVDYAYMNTNGICAGGQVSGSTIMNSACLANDQGNNMPNSPTTCDMQRVSVRMSLNPGPEPTPTPTPPPYEGCIEQQYACQWWEDWSSSECRCVENGGYCTSCGPPESPILIDELGNGFSLTDRAHGVRFNLDNDNLIEQIAWTSLGSDDSFLSLDRNNNGSIDSVLELFGDGTDQPYSDHPNGFIALAEYDKTEYGGNKDGIIDYRDFIFPYLRLWQDSNHDGISQPIELKSLIEKGLSVIELDYKESRKTDQYGNQFRYRSKVRDLHGFQSGRWAWDVWLTSK